LQVISSLLSLQSRTVDDKNASDALRQSQSRVMAMSLIHHNLYKNGPASQLDINEYLTNLCQQIFNSYNLVGDKLRLQTEIAYSLIDVNLLVPLGLIINELITNSLKYAFKDRVSGNIIVTGHFMDNAIILKVQDDGIGDTAEPNITGFGTKLVETFAKKINAQIIKKFENGTLTTIIINQNKKGNGDS
jgi:two-component sensor histidine kinase